MLEDHVWTLKSFDNNNVGVVKLQCGECQKDFGGGSGDHSKSTIHNLFANFKKSYIILNAHICNWCRCKEIPWTEYSQTSVQKDKILILTAEDHKQAIEDGLAILDTINRDIYAEWGRFRVVILGIRRFMGGRVGVPAHYARRKPGVLDIFSEYSLKLPRTGSNILKYTRYFLVGQAWRSIRRGGRAGAQTTLGRLLQLETLRVTISSPASTKFVAKCVAISSNSVPPRRTWQLI
jgi:hypothetical protein